MPKSNSNRKRGKSGRKSKLETLTQIKNIGKVTAKKYIELESKFKTFKEKAEKRGLSVPFALPRYNVFKPDQGEQLRQVIKNTEQYLKNPVVDRQSKDTNRLSYNLIEEEKRLVKKYNTPIKNFMEKMGKRKITIGGVEQEQTVKEYLEQYEGNKDYTMTEQWRYLTEEELKERVKYLREKTKKNSMMERKKMAKENYLKAMETEGLDRTPEGKKLYNKIKRMSLKRFMDRFSTDVEASITFMYDENLDVTDRLNSLIGAWKTA